ncbi:low specificity L-threonine aldolase [Actinoplanes sp. DH11]|uniref:threonine aldolase family protein n=1 Tax=Actinoplanes sp. DH11 TaxID=2857011 RepID=UPI001E3E1C82|nr:beta-eliminating lyase-related protein [Actinoplanes sp. DH11]
MPENTQRRRTAAMRACDRILSGVRPTTMRERLAELSAVAHLDDLPDYYGDGPVTVLEQRVANLLGAEAAVWFPTGTMAQQVALRFGARETDAVALHPLGHQLVHERDAYAALTGLRAVLPTTAPRNPTAAEIVALDERVGTVVFELPMRDAGFVLPTWDELTEACAAAENAGARVHFDGARIWESAPYLGRSLVEIAEQADSVYVSFYKTLGGLSGAVLAGTGELAGFARAWRHRHGGNVFQQWPAVLAALDGLDRELPRVGEYVRHARTIADALAGLPGARVHPHPPHTHQFRFFLPHRAEALNAATLDLAERERIWFAGMWQDTEVPGVAMTEVTIAAAALEWTAADVAAAAERLFQHL